MAAWSNTLCINKGQSCINPNMASPFIWAGCAQASQETLHGKPQPVARWSVKPGTGDFAMPAVPDISPKDTWNALAADQDAVLIDVRTDAEWNFVGLPDLMALGKQVVLIPWQLYPSMQVNDGFAEDLQAAGLTPGQKIYFICRSGARSQSAGQAAQAAGFPHAFNVADGFEGPVDGAGHRGSAAGWKASGLPWRQR
jgi:rhodanese-related sulfurtransferase